MLANIYHRSVDGISCLFRFIFLNLVLIYSTCGMASAADSPLGIISGLGMIKENYSDLVDQLDPGFVRFTIQSPAQDELFEQYMQRSSGRRQMVVTVIDFHGDNAAYLKFIQNKARKWGKNIRFWMLGNELDLDPRLHADEVAMDKYVDDLTQFHKTLTSAFPGSRIAISFSAQAAVNGRYKTILSRLANDVPNTISIIDLHYHKPWRQGENISRHIQPFREFARTLPAFNNAVISITENSTWSDKPAMVKRLMKSFPAQTEYEQGVYCAESFYTAFASGIDTVSCGIARDRSQIRGDTAAHPFTLNGHMYNPARTYTFTPTGPAKTSAYTFRLISWLNEGSHSRNVSALTTNTRAVTAYAIKDGKRPHVVVWLSRARIAAGEGSARVRFKPPFPGDLVVVDLVNADKPAWPIDDPATAYSFRQVQRDRSGNITLDLKNHSPVALLPVVSH